MRVQLNLDNVTMMLGNKGVLLKIADNEGKHLGDLRIGKAHAVWMKGKTHEANGIKIPIAKLIEAMESRA